MHKSNLRMRISLRLRGSVHVFILPLWARKALGACLPPYFSRSQFRSVYVATYGRSGSTLLMRWLSTLPGFSIKGENKLFMLPALDCEPLLESAMQFNSRAGIRWLGDGPKNPWCGVSGLSVNRWRRDFVNALLNQLYPRDLIPYTIGFKEIRWHELPEESRGRRMDWIKSLRPPGAVIFLFRDLGDVMNSGWWQSMPSESRMAAIQDLKKFEAWAQNYCNANKESTFIIRYEEFVSNRTVVAQLCNFLGVPFSEVDWRFVLSEPLSHLK